MLKMFQNKIKIQKIDIYSFALISVIFALDRFSKIYVIELIQSEGEIFLYDFLNLTLNWNTINYCTYFIVELILYS